MLCDGLRTRDNGPRITMFGDHRWSSWALDCQCCRLVVVPTTLWHADFRAESVHPPPPTSGRVRARLPLLHRLQPCRSFTASPLLTLFVVCCTLGASPVVRFASDLINVIDLFPHLRSDFRNSFIDGTIPPHHLRHRFFGVFVDISPVAVHMPDTSLCHIMKSFDEAAGRSVPPFLFQLSLHISTTIV